VASRLPRPIVDIPEIVEYAGFQPARLCDCFAGHYASGQRARVNFAWTPSRCNAPGHSICLGTPAFGHPNVAQPAKPFGFDAFDVSVTDQENFGHTRPRGSACHHRHAPRGAIKGAFPSSRPPSPDSRSVKFRTRSSKIQHHCGVHTYSVHLFGALAIMA